MQLTISNLNKRFGEKQIFDDFNMTVEDGQTVCVLGSSGMGKSTLLKHIIGFMKPDSGSIKIGDIEIAGKRERELFKIRREHMAMVFQAPALLNSLTVGENMALGLVERGEKTREEIDAVVHEKLRVVGLENEIDSYPHELSGGMQKRVGVARALALEPRIILYDEPTSGLDPINSHEIFEVIKDLKERFGITSVCVTHDVVGALYVSDKLGLLNNGKLVEFTTPEGFKHSANELVKNFLVPFEERRMMAMEQMGHADA